MPVPPVPPVAAVAPVAPIAPRASSSAQMRETERVAAAEARVLAAEDRAMARATPRATPRAITIDGGEYSISRWRDDAADRRISAEDAAWLRGVYPRLETTRLKSRAALVLARATDEPTTTWLMALVQRDEEPADVRAAILSRLGEELPMVQLGRLYDGAASRTMRLQVVQLLGRRQEPEATDKLIEIVRSGTDPQLRRAAITALNGKKDPRTTQLLLELIDR
jgi:HEAT repeat protein